MTGASQAGGAMDLGHPPFDRLTPDERNRIAAAADIAFYRTGAELVKAGEEPPELFLIIKGLVAETDGDTVMTVHGPGDLAGINALTAPAATALVVREETVAHLIPRQLLLDLTRLNPGFAQFFSESIGERLAQRAAAEATRSFAPFMVARVGQAYLHPPVRVAAGTDLREAARTMKARQCTSLLVAREDGVDGMLTGTDLREAALIRELPLDTPVGTVANFSTITVDEDEYLFQAQILMTRHGIRRLPVQRAGEIVGILDLTDLLGFMSSHSHLVLAQIERAGSVEDLRVGAAALRPLLQALDGSGVKIRAVAEMVSELSQRIVRRLFEFLAPPELQPNSCLLVMGSEGRSEQIAKTDQDNALILRDGAALDPALVEGFCRRFTEAMIALGYPPCPGGMMVSNPAWTRTESSFRAEVARWTELPDGNAFINLAALVDAAAVAGDPALLDRLRRHLFERLSDTAGFLSRFASPIQQFETPIGFFHQILLGSGGREGAIDIKKGGIFPVVHGARALALERRLTPSNSFERIAAIAEEGFFDRRFATDLSEAFGCLLGLRLKAWLAAGGAATDENLVRAADLSRLQRDALKDSLIIVKQFKLLVAHHFRLDAF